MPNRVFVSYASFDAKGEKYLYSFLDQLGNDLSKNLNREKKDILFFDQVSIQTGDEWREKLARGLESSDLFLCLCSDGYFESKYCTAEFNWFLDRRAEWKLASPGSEARPTIFPVIWVPSNQVPQEISDFQDRDGHYPQEYREIGLRNMLRHRDIHRARYGQALRRITALLIEAIRTPQLQCPESKVDYAALRYSWRSFSPAPRDGTVNVAYVAGTKRRMRQRRNYADCYDAEDPGAWRPYCKDSATVRDLVSRAVENLHLVRAEKTFDDVFTKFVRTEGHRHSSVALLVVDVWSTKLDEIQRRLKRFDGEEFFNCDVLVPWDELDLETMSAKHELKRDLHLALGQKLIARNWDVACTPRAFVTALESAITELWTRLLRRKDVLHPAGGDGKAPYRTKPTIHADRRTGR